MRALLLLLGLALVALPIHGEKRAKRGMKVKILAQEEDSLMMWASSRQCGANGKLSWPDLQKKCGVSKIDKPNFYKALDQVKSNNLNILIVNVHSSNMSPNGQLNLWPKIHFPTKKLVDGKWTGKYNYPAIDRKKIEETLKTLQNKDFLFFNFGCSGDRRGLTHKKRLKNAKAKLGVNEVRKVDGKYVPYRSDFAKHPLAFGWEDMLSIQDQILDRAKKHSFFPATLKETATYYYLRDAFLKGPRAGLLKKGLVIVHNIPGSLSYPGLKALSFNLQKDAQRYSNLGKVWKNLQTIIKHHGEKVKKTSNHFVATISHGLQGVFDVIRFCRSGVIKRPRGLLKMSDVDIVKKCLGSDDHSYLKYMECCVGHLYKRHKTAATSARTARKKKRSRSRSSSTRRTDAIPRLPNNAFL